MKVASRYLALLFLLISHISYADTWYVSLTSTQNGPGTNWATAFHEIQEGIDETSAGDLVLVTNGTYSTGGATVHSMDNRVALTKIIRLKSVNGPAHTSIIGAGPPGPSAVRCAYITNGASMIGFTLTGGHTRDDGEPANQRYGGGIWLDNGGVVSNCVITANSADRGGGAYCHNGGTLIHCEFRLNSADKGGGIYCNNGGMRFPLRPADYPMYA